MAAPIDGSHETFRAFERSRGPSNRSFGFTFAAVFGALCALASWRRGSVDLWLLGAAAAFLVVTLTVPGALGPLNRIWSAFGGLLHAVVSPIILAVLFYAAITPIGLLSRLFGHDPLRRKIDPAAKTYWIERPQQARKTSMKNQF
jgi:hypothetical protein